MIVEIKIMLLIFLLTAAVYMDIRYRRIPNLVTLPGIAVGLLLNAVQGWDPFVSALGGFLTGTALLFIPFALGGMGAGDVKLLACIGAFFGVRFVLVTAIFMGLVGGVLALFFMLKDGTLRMTCRRLIWMFAGMAGTHPLFRTETNPGKAGAFPYGIAIVIGCGIAGFYFYNNG
ncbi:prepilin peptidase [Aneurinibacillus sp. BA2021]|nr:prepilin peptidase [Aneurinibacillus sp. BA2021]